MRSQWWRTKAKRPHATPLPIPKFAVQFVCGRLTAGRMKALGEAVPGDACEQCLSAVTPMPR